MRALRRAAALAMRSPAPSWLAGTPSGCGSVLSSSARHLGTDGRVTNEDRRWWLLHLECAPDITPGTFVAWLDACGTHTTKKLIERDIWTIEQVAALDADVVDELKYKEGCLRMDVVWEHARTILSPLRQRQEAGGVETALQSRVLQLRKKRELERHRANVMQERDRLMTQREKLLHEQREAIAAKKEALRQKLEQVGKARGAASPSHPDEAMNPNGDTAAADGGTARSSPPFQ